MIRILIAAILTSCTCVAYSQDTTLRPVIFHCTESAGPGEPVGIQGHALGTTAEVWFGRVADFPRQQLKPEQKLTINTSAESFISAQLPANVPMGLYAVWIKNSAGISKPAFINKARIQTSEFNEVMPRSLFRLFGRNLSGNNSSPKAIVTFIHAKTGREYQAQAFTLNSETVSVLPPSGIEPGVYTIRFNNGWGNKYGDHDFDETILVRPAKEDIFKMKVPWGGDFDFAGQLFNVKTDPRLIRHATGNGSTSDHMAIQEAIDKAFAAGGGVVYLPAGHYKLQYDTGAGITMRSRVVLKGDGKDKTFIDYGYGKPFSTERVKASYGWTLGWPDSRTEGMALIWPGGVTTSGLFDLAMMNKNESRAFVHTIKNMPEGASKIVLQNCAFDVNTGWGLALVNIDKLLMQGCTIISTTQSVRGINAPTRTWPWDLKNSWNVIVRNNEHFYTAGRFGANGCHHAIFENNSFVRDGDHQAHGETGGLSLDYVTNIVVLENRFTVTGASILPRNQGETILSQAGMANQQTVGQVTAATATTITDRKQEWQDFTDRASIDWQMAVFPMNYSIVIVEGTGKGQWRTITGNNDTTLTVNKAWDVIPSAGSRYVITQWSAYQMLVKNNILKDNNRGIWFYCGGNDIHITGNTLINSEGIYIRADQRMENKRYNLSWNTTITDNHIENTDGKRPAHICFLLAQVKSPRLHGTGVMGADVRRNLVKASAPNATKGFVKYEGYLNYIEEGGDPKNPSRDTSTAGILGTIFFKNKVSAANQAYLLSSGVQATTIQQSDCENTAQFIKDIPHPLFKTTAKATSTDEK